MKDLTNKIGIDSIGFYTPGWCLDLKELASARNIDYKKFYDGLLQHKMSVPTEDEDVVTMAAEASSRILDDQSKKDVIALIFATETGIDQSKSAGMFLHGLLGLNKNCRVVEFKQSCYGGICALQFAVTMLNYEFCNNRKDIENKKILVISSDIARYGLGTKGESSQGAGAVAITVSLNPKILEIEYGQGIYASDKMDFWRPNHMQEAIVFGRYSCELYKEFLYKAWQDYNTKTNRDFYKHDYFCYHASIPKLVIKAHESLYNKIFDENIDNKICENHLTHSLKYGQIIGNCYTASIKLALISLLDNINDDLSDKRIGFYSYGSGSIAEFFSGIVQPTYHEKLDTEYNKKIISERHILNINEYEKIYNKYSINRDDENYQFYKFKNKGFRLKELKDNKRIYEQI